MAQSSPPEQSNCNIQYHEKSSPCFLWTLALAPCLMPAVWKYHVTVTESVLSFGYSSECMQATIERANILEAEALEHINGFLDWGGYGIRKQLPSWDTGYVARNGPAVRVKVKRPSGKETNYTFSCRDPDEVVRLLTCSGSNKNMQRVASHDDASLAWSNRDDDVLTIDTTENTPNHGNRSLGAATQAYDEKQEGESLFRYYEAENGWKRRSSKPGEDQLPGASPPSTPTIIPAARTGHHAFDSRFENDDPTMRMIQQTNEETEKKDISNCCCCQVYCCGWQVTSCMCCLAVTVALLLVSAAAFGGSVLAYYATEVWEWSWPWSTSERDSASIIDTTSMLPTASPLLVPMPQPTFVPTSNQTRQKELLADARLAEITKRFVEANDGDGGAAINQAIMWVSSHDLAMRPVDDPLLNQRIVLASMAIEGPISSWRTAQHECEWEGIECDENNVVQVLNLAGLSLSSTIPDAMNLLTGLRMVDFSNNNLTGRMPGLAKTLNLTHVNFSNNMLNGALPEKMYSLQNLIEVAVSRNSLTGQVPLWLDQWTVLEVLDLSYNMFSGPIPSTLGTLSLLERMNLSNNKLTGTLPLQLFQLTNLTELNLARNNIIGSIPSEILFLKSLQLLDLSFNNMTGPVPMLQFSLVNLTSLSLDANNFEPSTNLTRHG